MTNKEAIEWLISMYNIANQINDCLEYKETLDIAIKALEKQPCECTEHPCLGKLCEYYKQPCEDCISREEVKDKLMELWTKYMPMELDMHLSFVLEKISELPSVTPQTRWIPISEGLPEPYQECLFTVEAHHWGNEPIRYQVIQKAYGGETNFIAWMPLPQPYTESEEV